LKGLPRNQKAKGKRQKAKMKTRLTSLFILNSFLLIFAFCLLPFDFLL